MYDELHLQCNNLKVIQDCKFSVKAFLRNISHVSFHFYFLLFSFRNMELSSKTQNNFSDTLVFLRTAFKIFLSTSLHAYRKSRKSKKIAIMLCTSDIFP